MKRRYDESHPEAGAASMLEVCLAYVCERRSEHVKQKGYEELRKMVKAGARVEALPELDLDYKPVQLLDQLDPSDTSNQLYQQAITHSLHQAELDRPLEKPTMKRSPLQATDSAKAQSNPVLQAQSVDNLVTRLERSLKVTAKTTRIQADLQRTQVKGEVRRNQSSRIRVKPARLEATQSSLASGLGGSPSTPTLHHQTYDAFRKVAVRDFKVARKNIQEHLRMKKMIAMRTHKRDKKHGGNKSKQKKKVKQSSTIKVVVSGR